MAQPYYYGATYRWFSGQASGMVDSPVGCRGKGWAAASGKRNLSKAPKRGQCLLQGVSWSPGEKRATALFWVM